MVMSALGNRYGTDQLRHQLLPVQRTTAFAACRVQAVAGYARHDVLHILGNHVLASVQPCPRASRGEQGETAARAQPFCVFARARVCAISACT